MQDRFAGKSEWFASHYQSTRGRVRLSLVLERLRQRLAAPPQRILDAGGGTGAFAIPLAMDGYDVTLLDASPEWLEAARSEAARSGTALHCVLGSVEDASELIEPSFDAILCHAVLMYVDDLEQALHALRSVATPAALLSLLEKNRDGIALRPGLQGEYREARRLLVEGVSTGRLGIPNRAQGYGNGRLCSAPPAGACSTGRVSGCSPIRRLTICARTTSRRCSISSGLRALPSPIGALRVLFTSWRKL
jgi:S-adenosylmethionine-dependent methyltransferase